MRSKLAATQVDRPYSQLRERKSSDGYMLKTCRDDDGEVINGSLLLGFEDDEEGAGFADDPEEDGLAWVHFLQDFGKLGDASDRVAIDFGDEIAFLNAFGVGEAASLDFRH